MKRKQIVLSVVLCLLPIILGVILWNELPEQIAVHFDNAGNPDNYAPKAFAVFGLPVFIAVVDAFTLFTTRMDPKAKRHSRQMLRLVYWACPLLCNIIMPITLFMAMGKEIPIGMVVSLMVGLVIVIAGNYLPKCRQNYTIGIKLPWTLNDEENWNYTHRIAGFVWVLAGLAIMVNAFTGSSGVMFAIILFMVAIPFICSFIFYQKNRAGRA
ncbi:MAG: SdpI family protein [Lachnospiraceae bacterium]|nr:SdpI family protein [Lachnospiraceae bacterium]